ncbi:A24 family peptidase [Mycetocola sp. 2940]|uniref:prepilin peptidase n=1 Tax=Mycetocola sp. 2940 TaxID=3156452 RepID=UPI00339AE95E
MTPFWLVPVLGLMGGIVGVALGAVTGRVLKSPRHLPLPARVATAGATAFLFALSAALFGAAWLLPAICVFAAVAVVLGTVDLIEKRLPNAVLYPSLGALVVLLACTSLMTGDWAAFLGAVCAGAGLFALYFVLAVISPSGIGMGDVKLAALIGLMLGYLGWMPLVIGGTVGFLIGGLTSLIALTSGRASLKTAIPFGPAMLAGVFLGMLAA